ncbi:MAG: YgcG family protein [Planctomycetaceae bacterium]
MFNRFTTSVALWVTVTCLSLPAVGQEFNLERPGAREFVRDSARLLDETSIAQIRNVCDTLLTDKATPIIVVTIESMAQHGGRSMPIETFAAHLFNQWQIGHKKLDGQNWNTGILLLISKRDRKARIELGAGWGRFENQTCQRIMDEHIVPRMKAGDFSGGILAGVEELDRMARKLELSGPPLKAEDYILPGILFALALFTCVSVIRSGPTGWAWVFWAGLFTIAFLVLRVVLRGGSGDGYGGGGGGFSGGSFGGGSSGGGGATGSW